MGARDIIQQQLAIHAEEESHTGQFPEHDGKMNGTVLYDRDTADFTLGGSA